LKINKVLKPIEIEKPILLNLAVRRCCFFSSLLALILLIVSTAFNRTGFISN